MGKGRLSAVIENDVLTIQLLINKPPVLSKSQKSLVVATSNGNQIIPVMLNGGPTIELAIGVNAYVYAAMGTRIFEEAGKEGKRVQPLTVAQRKKVEEHNRQVTAELQRGQIRKENDSGG